MDKKPWEFDAEFTDCRLTDLANLIAMVREEVIELHDDELGDTRLALGMRAYECCKTRITRASHEDSYSWLAILTPQGRFTFSIGGHPVRFSRNDAESLPDRKLIVSEEAKKQYELFVTEPNVEGELIWFFVFDTEYNSAADSVYFVGYSESGEVVCKWQIPVEDRVTLISEVSESLPEPVETPKARVGIKRTPITAKDQFKDESKG